MKKENIINLIKYHTQKNEVAFNNEVQLIARFFDENGDMELAQYILAMISMHNVFIPQELNNEPEESNIVTETSSSYERTVKPIKNLEYFSQVNLDTEPLLLPDKISDEINRIIIAITHKRRVNKFLFAGVPGTGKTESVKQIARILNMELYAVNFSAVIDSKLGQSGKNIVELFDEMNQFADSRNVLFLFDEIDVLALSRLDSNDLREMGRVTSYMMRGLDYLSNDVLLIATTNLSESMDKALLRRFDATIDFNQYNTEELLDIAEQLLVNSGEVNDVQITNKPLFKKIISLLDPIPYPGDLKNLINSSVAFSRPSVPEDYLHRLFQKIVSKLDDENTGETIQKLYDLGFTVRELESLTGVSKSQISRMTRSE